MRRHIFKRSLISNAESKSYNHAATSLLVQPLRLPMLKFLHTKLWWTLTKAR